MRDRMATMVEQLISKADNEFQQGNFAAAAELYTQILADFDGSENSDKLTNVVQKLADAEYALDRYDEAKKHYSRLVTLWDSVQVPGKDKVMVFFKLAKSSDKLGDQNDASSYFSQSYELAKTTLSKTHFLNATIRDGYADWLRATGHDSVKLKELEEAGSKPVETLKTETPIEEVSAETVKLAGSVAGIAREQENFVVKKKLTKVRKSKAKQQSEEGQDQENQEKKEIKDLSKPQTIEQQVAERKFLRKKEGQEKVQPSRRQKLRNALSEERDEKASTSAKDQDQQEGVAPDGGLDFTPPSEPTARRSLLGDLAEETDRIGLDQITADQIAQIDKIEKIISEPTYRAPINNPGVNETGLDIDPEVAKLITKKPRRHFSDKLEASRQKKNLETSIVPESSRSFLQHADLVKKSLDPETEKAPDLVHLKTEELPRLEPSMTNKALGLMKFAMPVGALGLLALAVFLMVKQMSATHAPPIPTFATNLINQEFVTADGAVTLTIEPDGAHIKGVVNRIAPVHYWTGSIQDELDMLTGKFASSRWLTVVPEGLKEQNGVELYGEKAPERKVIAMMKDIAMQAQQYYTNNSDYPSYSTNLTKPDYKNPFTEKQDTATVFSGVDKRLTSPEDGPLDKDLKDGHLFSNETPIHAGDIHELSVIAAPSYSGADNNYKWKIHCFYVHGCDREGKLLGSGAPNKAFLITLKNGLAMKDDPSPVLKDYTLAAIALTQSDIPNTGAILGKYGAIGLGALLLIVLLQRYSTVVPQGRRRL